MTMDEDVEFPWSSQLLSSIKYHSNEILWIHKSHVTREEWSVANGGFYVVETNVNINLNQWKRTHNNVKQWN